MIEHGMTIKASEYVSSATVGGATIQVDHSLAYALKEESENVWSSRIALIGMQQVTLDLASLDAPNIPAKRDLYAGQELHVVAIHNEGDHLVVITFKSGIDEMLRLSFPPSGRLYISVEAGEIFSGDIDQIEMLALTGDTVVSLLLATKLEVAP